jgi:hypothetical protein
MVSPAVTSENSMAEYFPLRSVESPLDNLSHRLWAADSHARLPVKCLNYRRSFGSGLAVQGESLYKIGA